MKFLLSTGKSTDRVEVYVLDLFKLYLNIMPGDIPGTDIGFDFVLTDTLKSNLVSEVKRRVNSIVKLIQSRFDEKKVQISVSSLEFINDEKLKLVVSVNKTTSEEIVVNYT
jgi:hypothetical protein